MPSLSLTEFVYPKKEEVKGVVLKSGEQLEWKSMPITDFDFSEPKPIEFNEEFYRERFPNLPNNAYFVLAMTSKGLKPKQIRSLWKKEQKKMKIEKGHKLVAFE